MNAQFLFLNGNARPYLAFPSEKAIFHEAKWKDDVLTPVQLFFFKNSDMKFKPLPLQTMEFKK